MFNINLYGITNDCGLTASESADFIRQLDPVIQRVEEGGIEVIDHSTEEHCQIIMTGCCSRSVIVDTQLRILDFVLPGDISRLRSVEKTDRCYFIRSLSSVEIANVRISTLITTMRRYGVYERTLIDNLHQSDTIMLNRLISRTSTNRRTRVCGLLYEIYLRQMKSGLVENNSFYFPVTLLDLSSTLDLTLAELNRAIEEIREDGVVHVSRQRIQIVCLKSFLLEARGKE